MTVGARRPDRDGDMATHDTDGSDEGNGMPGYDDEYLRCKWIGDGATSIDDLIVKLREHIRFLEVLKANGWEIVGEMRDDWAMIVRPTPGLAPAGATDGDDNAADDAAEA